MNDKIKDNNNNILKCKKSIKDCDFMKKIIRLLNIDNYLKCEIINIIDEINIICKSKLDDFFKIKRELDLIYKSNCT